MIFRIVCIVALIVSSSSLQAQKSATEISGDLLQIALPVGAAISTLIWNDTTKPIFQFAKTMSVSFVTTHAIKRIVDKERPNGGRYSFPSGHTSAAFTGAAFLEKRFGWRVGAPAYVLASYVGWSRIDANKHDIWDVLGGAVVGIGSAYLFAKPYVENKVSLGMSKQAEQYTLRLVVRI